MIKQYNIKYNEDNSLVIEVDTDKFTDKQARAFIKHWRIETSGVKDATLLCIKTIALACFKVSVEGQSRETIIKIMPAIYNHMYIDGSLGVKLISIEPITFNAYKLDVSVKRKPKSK